MRISQTKVRIAFKTSGMQRNRPLAVHDCDDDNGIF
jgi:hypothetical protein